MSAAAQRLLAAVRATPRRHRLPPLPADAAAARATGTEAMIALALEQARLAIAQGLPAPEDARALFLEGLQRLVAAALAGDPGFQADVLLAAAPEVAEHVALAEQATVDQRTLRGLLDPIAHPGRLRQQAPGPLHDALAELHRQASAGEWSMLRAGAGALLGDASVAARLHELIAHPALARRERAAALAQDQSVRRYRELVAQRNPAAGSAAAAAQGRDAAAAGAAAEAQAAKAFDAIAGALGPPHRAVQGLRIPAGFPGRAQQAKDEWDGAIVDGAGGLLLLAEVKASPAAASGDFPRLLRGLQRLAHAESARTYAFASAAGSVTLAGTTLRHLQPHGETLPPHVVYCCAAPPERRAPLLAPVAKALLLAAAAPQPEDLARVWDAVTREPRMRGVLHQYETAQAVRAAMLHPDELLAAALAS